MSRFIAAALACAVLLAAATAAAQGQRGPNLPPEPGEPGPGPSPANCQTSASAVTVDPALPRTGTNYHSIGAAICAVKSSADAGGTITVSGRNGRAYREEFTVWKPGVTIKAAQGETVAVAPTRARCVSVTAGPATLDGFAFRPSPGAGACVDVKSGALTLANSRIDLPDAVAVAVRAGAGTTLTFTGGGYGAHGIFGVTAPSAPYGTLGIRAEAASTLNLSDLRIENLAAGIDSRASANSLTRVRFSGNLNAVTIIDENSSPAALTISGGGFAGSNTAISLITGAPGADLLSPFRGKVKITGELNDPVDFERNAMALATNASGFLETLEISSAIFRKNFVHALQFRLPANTTASIKNSVFEDNGRAVTIVGPLDGKLELEGSIAGGDGQSGVYIEGGTGFFDATLTRATGYAITLGGGYLEPNCSAETPANASKTSDSAVPCYNVVVNGEAGRELLYVYSQSRLCDAGRDNKWDAFRAALNDVRITIDGKSFASAFSEKGKKPSKSELREAFAIICGGG